MPRRRREPPAPLPKRAWGPGPWQDEPDQHRWTHAGLECYLFRHMLVTGALNGYVAVTPEHPWWGKDYNECIATPPCDPDPPIDFDAMPRGFPVPPASMRRMMNELRWSCVHRPEALLDVHGGVTYGGPMMVIAGDQEEEFAWGFGFDTGHAGDVTPAMDATLRQIYLEKPDGAREWAERERIFKEGPFGTTYKTFAYVKRETEQLAEQLAIVKGAGWAALRLSDESDDPTTPGDAQETMRCHSPRR